MVKFSEGIFLAQFREINGEKMVKKWSINGA